MSRVVMLRSHTLQIREAKTGCRLCSLVLQGRCLQRAEEVWWRTQASLATLPTCINSSRRRSIWMKTSHSYAHAHMLAHTCAHAHTYRKNQTLPPNVTMMCIPTSGLVSCQPLSRKPASTKPVSPAHPHQSCLHSLSFPISSLIRSWTQSCKRIVWTEPEF